MFSVFLLTRDFQNRPRIRTKYTISILSILFNSRMACKNSSSQKMAPKSAFSPLSSCASLLHGFTVGGVHPQNSEVSLSAQTISGEGPQQKILRKMFRGENSPKGCSLGWCIWQLPVFQTVEHFTGGKQWKMSWVWSQGQALSLIDYLAPTT